MAGLIGIFGYDTVWKMSQFAYYRYMESKGLIGVTIEWIPKRGKIVLKT